MSTNIFNTVQLNAVKSNVFDLSHDVKMSFNMGDLVPINCMEVLPGDVIKMSSAPFLRMAPMIAPVMHQVNATVHHFFVPNRILWDGWEKFITGGENPEITPAYPYITDFAVTAGSLPDYFGLPLTEGMNRVSALIFAAYQMICNEYYRDQNLIVPFEYKLRDGNNSDIASDLFKLRQRAWRHDYFTGSLPFAQKGPAVSIPIGDFTDVGIGFDNTASPTEWNNADGTAGVNGAMYGVYDAIAGHGHIRSTNSVGKVVNIDNSEQLYAKTSELDLEAATINNLRVAFRLQEWFERNARGGSRYIESILSHFGVKSSDGRLNRPEYLGGSRQPMVISEVLQTSETIDSPQGNMAGHGVSASSGKSFTYRAEEHGFCISIISILPETAYQQGIPKMFKKFDRLDHAWPVFAHLGEQEVKNYEVYYSPEDPANDGTFGYVPRYAEYRYLDSRVAGEFQTSLSFWHMGRIFSERPHLNESFVTANPTSRIFAVEDPDSHKIYSHIFNRIKVVRKLPKFGTPSF